MFTLNNGNFQLAGGGPVANGSVKLTLSNSSAIILATGGAAPTTYIFNLDSNGNLPAGSQAFGNAELGPFGTFYTAQVFNAPNATGTLITTSTWIVGPSAPYVGTLFPNVTVLPPISIAGQVTGSLSITGNSGLPAATSANLYMGGTFGSPILGKIYVGDGTGWELDFAKRVTSVDTTLFKMKDSGVFDASVGFTIAGAAASGNVLRGNGTNFVSGQLAAADLSNGVTGSGAVVLATSPTISGTLSVSAIKQATPTGAFSITDNNGVTHFFISGTAPYTNTFIQGNGSGNVFLGSAAKTSVSDTTGVITMSGATSGTTAIQASAVAGSTTLTLPAATDTLVGKATTDTLTNKTLGGAGSTSKDTLFNRLRATQGTALTTGDIGSLTGWGSTASVSSVVGTDSAFQVLISCAGTGQAINPSFVVTFKDGTWTNFPIVQITRGEGNAPSAPPFVFSVSATQLTVGGLLSAAPVPGNIYSFMITCTGR